MKFTEATALLLPPLPTRCPTTGHLLRVLSVSHGATAGRYCFTWSFRLSFHVHPLSSILAFYSFLFPIHIQLPHPVLCPSKSLPPAAVGHCLLPWTDSICSPSWLQLQFWSSFCPSARVCIPLWTCSVSSWPTRLCLESFVGQQGPPWPGTAWPPTSVPTPPPTSPTQPGLSHLGVLVSRWVRLAGAPVAQLPLTSCVILCYCSSPPLESEIMWKDNVEEHVGEIPGTK